MRARRCWRSCVDDSGLPAPWCRQEAARLDPPVEGLGELSEANSVTGVQVFAVLVQEALDDGTLFLEVCVWVHGVLGVWRGWIAAPTDVERQPAMAGDVVFDGDYAEAEADTELDGRSCVATMVSGWKRSSRWRKSAPSAARQRPLRPR